MHDITHLKQHLYEEFNRKKGEPLKDVATKITVFSPFSYYTCFMT